MTVYALRHGFYQCLLGIYSTEELAWAAAHREHAEDGAFTPFEDEEYQVTAVVMDQDAYLF